METTIRISGMSCGHCVRAVEQAIRRLSGVREVRVTIGEAVVTTDGPPDLTTIHEAVRAEGYEVA